MEKDKRLKGIFEAHFPAIHEQEIRFKIANMEFFGVQTQDSLSPLMVEETKLVIARDAFHEQFRAAGGTEKQARQLYGERVETFQKILEKHFPVIWEQNRLYETAAHDTSNLQTPDSLNALKIEEEKLDAVWDAFLKSIETAGGTGEQAQQLYAERVERQRWSHFRGRFTNG